METNDQDEVIVDDVEETNEEVAETPEETPAKADKPKRTPQEELEYFEGRAERLRKKLGLKEEVEPTKPTQPNKPGEDLDYGEKAYLRSALNLKGSDELQLARDWKKKYGSTVEEMEADEVFLSRLTGLRDSRETMGAIPKGKGRSSHTTVTNLDIAISKFKETGELPKDFETRNKVVDAVTREEKGSLFSNTSVSR